jgi:hypothetical protein
MLTNPAVGMTHSFERIRMSYLLSKPKWIRRAVETHNWHVNKVKDDDGWTISDTARVLKRSYGSVNEDLLIADWYESHEEVISKFRHANQALNYIRLQKKKIESRIID